MLGQHSTIWCRNNFEIFLKYGSKYLVMFINFDYILFSSHCFISLYFSAISSDNKLFETVCAFGKLVSTECLKASQLVSFLVSSGLSNSTEASVDLCRNMVECNVLKPGKTRFLFNFHASYLCFVFCVMCYQKHVLLHSAVLHNHRFRKVGVRSLRL